MVKFEKNNHTAKMKRERRAAAERIVQKPAGSVDPMTLKKGQVIHLIAKNMNSVSSPHRSVAIRSCHLANGLIYKDGSAQYAAFRFSRTQTNINMSSFFANIDCPARQSSWLRTTR